MELYYIQKYTSSKGITNKSKLGPLQNMLKDTLKMLTKFANSNNYQVGMVISPGYLSTTSSTAQDLINQLINHNSPTHTWILGTMNGNNPKNAPKGKKFIDFTFQALHNNATQPSLVSYPSPFKKDHRKMVFFVLWKKGKQPQLNNKKDIANFIQNIEVPALSVGSSNFSKSTYFMGNDHNEADVLWINDNLLGPYNSAIEITDYNTRADIPSIVKSTVDSLPLNLDYLKEILKETLNSVIA
ncbi:hypothetical protein GA516_16335 [Lactobacillus pentosus]|uniref:hypothetical protein n=1 Tax=Lactiplantibacillus TaxID=2767842 RepID=UPI00128BDAAE|nr:hypothetical protein [Lactiplantibacillus pentosus]MPQ20825.1 hypothetical protein [Lactiplantibacillus pentosus]